MASYDVGRQAILAGLISLTSDNIKAALVNSDYTFGAAHAMSAITSYMATSGQSLSDRTITAAVFDAADVTWEFVQANVAVNGVVLYRDGSPQVPIAYWPLPLTITNGAPMTLAWSNLANRIFALH